MIYMISGKAHNGKDTFANFLKEELEKQNKKVCILHLASYLKQMINNYFEYDDEKEFRTLMQEVGTDLIRIKMGKKDYFTNRIFEDIEILNNYYDTFIISDVRLRDEFIKFEKKYNNVIKINITRPNFEYLTDKQEKHITETDLDNYNDFNYKVVNTTLDKLKNDAKKIVLEVNEL